MIWFWTKSRGGSLTESFVSSRLASKPFLCWFSFSRWPWKNTLAVQNPSWRCLVISSVRGAPADIEWLNQGEASDPNDGGEEGKNASSWCKSRARQEGREEAKEGLERSGQGRAGQVLIIYTQYRLVGLSELQGKSKKRGKKTQTSFNAFETFNANVWLSGRWIWGKQRGSGDENKVSHFMRWCLMLAAEDQYCMS